VEVLKKGTIESLLVPLRDRLGNVVDLSTVSGLLFDTKKKSDNSAAQSNVVVAIDGDFPMTAICQIDTSLAGYVGGEEYKLYLKYTAGTESPILGPIYFRVEDD
jgi:hypothetical protein